MPSRNMKPPMMLARIVGSRSSVKSSTGEAVRLAWITVERHGDRADCDQRDDDGPWQQVETGD